MVKENCGVVGIFSLDDANVIPMIIDSLRALQHRGQEAWGVAVPKKQPYKQLGLVSSAVSEFDKVTREYASPAAIGHVRYSTMGGSNLENAQPLKVKDLCIAHNGTISNVEELSGMVGGCTFTPQNVSDTLIAAKRLVSLMSENGKLGNALSILKNEMVGSFCFTFVSDDNAVYAARDPKGFRPMVVGFRKDTSTYIVASESAALAAVGAQLIRDVKPGELIKISNAGLESEMFSEEKKPAHCSFEFTYFAHPSSVMEGSNIYMVRKKIGQYLARKFPIKDADIVIPVPDSARPAALGYAQELGIQFEEGLLKDRYSRKGPLRSFIEPHQSDRVEINRWIIPITQVINGKHVVVVDDSLVRGTSSKAIIKALRRAGAKKISMVITFPPIKFPCYAGIDFPSQEELVTFFDNSDDYSEDEMIEKVRQVVGADFLGYNDAKNLADAIGIDANSMCFTCSSGDYSPLGIKPVFKSRAEIKGE
ncbi:MAG: amidophosphoribosyltransferase [Thaumarchaeota archaeon]|nr:amidophosphoribosyltransferase [Nitrososphaerota archaeon]MBI3642244.1 amidophosphoribosyltransferase [Nitrososphaerota archaeon]